MLDQFDHRRYLIPFRSLLLPHIITDTLVIGGGVAGNRAAIEAAAHGDVIMLMKDATSDSNTAWAQGGVAVVTGEGDTLAGHMQDTLDAGAGLSDAGSVQTLVTEGPKRIDELISWGMRFDRDDTGILIRSREGGHRHHRILHSDGDATGREMTRCLDERLRSHDNVRVFNRCCALDLLTLTDVVDRPSGEPPRVLGAITYHPRYGLQIIWASATILATGGAGRIYRETTNPSVATGDGLAMAYRAGATVADLEFVQFHPTTLYVAGSTRSLISEAVRGEGAHLVTRQGRRFMPEYHDMAELAPRDVVSRAIMDQLAHSGDECVYLDVRHFDVGAFASRFPGLHERIATFDIDPERDLIPVHPSAHYSVGGVWTDLDGRTSLPGLYAAGEVTCNGLHGANRLASNSLLEGLVFGARAGRACSEMAGVTVAPTKIVSEIHLPEHGELDLHDVRQSLRSAMWRNVGIERLGAKLDDVVDMFNFWARYTLGHIFDSPAGWETQNMLTVGALVTRAARWRCETRGVHARRDHPEADQRFEVHGLWRRGVDAPIEEAVDRIGAIA